MRETRQFAVMRNCTTACYFHHIHKPRVWKGANILQAGFCTLLYKSRSIRKQSNHTVSDPAEPAVVVIFGTSGFGCYFFVCKMELKALRFGKWLHSLSRVKYGVKDLSLMPLGTGRSAYIFKMTRSLLQILDARRSTWRSLLVKYRYFCSDLCWSFLFGPSRLIHIFVRKKKM